MAYRVVIVVSVGGLPPTHRTVLVLRFRGTKTMFCLISCIIPDGTDS